MTHSQLVEGHRVVHLVKMARHAALIDAVETLERLATEHDNPHYLAAAVHVRALL